VGVSPQADWSEWGVEVIEETGEALDFYIIHQYAYFEPPQTYAELLAQPQQAWSSIMKDANETFEKVGNGRVPPIAITEYNLFAVQEQDNRQIMKQAANMLFMADSIGQMLQNGFAMANQWNLANGEAGNGTDYGLMHAETFYRYPQYYVFPLWSRFGDQMLPVEATLPADSVLSVYAGLTDDQAVSILAVNKTGTAVSAEIHIDGLQSAPVVVWANVVSAPSLDSETVAVNEVEPGDDFGGETAVSQGEFANPFLFNFAPYSLTLLTIEPAE
jgi:hypothetical protein